jgi:hypothetical protein
MNAKYLVLLVALLVIACGRTPTAPDQNPPFTSPSLLVGEWYGQDADGRPAHLTGDGKLLFGVVYANAAPIQLRDDGSLTVGSCRATFDAVWRMPGGGFAFDTKYCVGAGRWVFNPVRP